MTQEASGVGFTLGVTPTGVTPKAPLTTYKQVYEKGDFSRESDETTAGAEVTFNRVNLTEAV